MCQALEHDAGDSREEDEHGRCPDAPGDDQIAGKTEVSLIIIQNK